MLILVSGQFNFKGKGKKQNKIMKSPQKEKYKQTKRLSHLEMKQHSFKQPLYIKKKKTGITDYPEIKKKKEYFIQKLIGTAKAAFRGNCKHKCFNC